MIVERQDDMVACAQSRKNKCTKEKRDKHTHTHKTLLNTENQLVVTTEEVGGEMGEIDKGD